MKTSHTHAKTRLARRAVVAALLLSMMGGPAVAATPMVQQLASPASSQVAGAASGSTSTALTSPARTVTPAAPRTATQAVARTATSAVPSGAASTAPIVTPDGAGAIVRWVAKKVAKPVYNALKSAAKRGYAAFKRAWESTVAWWIRRAASILWTVYEIYSAFRSLI